MKKPKPTLNFEPSNCVINDDTHDWGGFVKFERATHASPTFSEIKFSIRSEVLRCLNFLLQKH